MGGWVVGCLSASTPLSLQLLDFFFISASSHSSLTYPYFRFPDSYSHSFSFDFYSCASDCESCAMWFDGKCGEECSAHVSAAIDTNCFSHDFSHSYASPECVRDCDRECASDFSCFDDCDDDGISFVCDHCVYTAEFVSRPIPNRSFSQYFSLSVHLWFHLPFFFSFAHCSIGHVLV